MSRRDACLSGGVVTRIGLPRGVSGVGVKKKMEKENIREIKRKREGQPASQPWEWTMSSIPWGSTERTGSLSLKKKKKTKRKRNYHYLIMTAHTYIQHTAVYARQGTRMWDIERGRPGYVKVASFSGTFFFWSFFPNDASKAKRAV